jgi:hypothetical protein
VERQVRKQEAQEGERCPEANRRPGKHPGVALTSERQEGYRPEKSELVLRVRDFPISSGDLVVRGRPGTFYFPIMTSIVVSVVLTLLLWLVSALKR